MSTANQYAINLLAQGAGRVVTVGANLLVFVLVARIGGTQFFGAFTYVTTFLGLFMLIADFGMAPVLARDIAQVRDRAESYWGNYLMLRFAISLVAIVFSAGAAYYIRRDLFLILLVGSLGLPFLSARFFEPIFQIYKRPWFSTWSSACYGMGYLFLVGGVLLFLPTMLSYVVGAFIAANVLYAVFTYKLTKRIIKAAFTLDLTLIKQILKLAFPLGVSSMFALISGRVPTFMLSILKSDYEVGIYNAAYKFFDLYAMLAVIVVSPFIPIFSAKAVNDLESVKRISTMMVELIGIVLIPIAIATPILSPRIVCTLFGNSFIFSAEVLNILVWGGTLVFLSLLTSAIVLSLGVVNFGYWNTACAAAVSVLLNYILIPKHGFLGAAYAIVVCELLLSGVTLYYVVRHLGNIFDGSHWLRIVCANLVFYGLLYNKLVSTATPLRIAGPLLIYILLILLFRAIPRESIRLFFEVIGRKSVLPNPSEK